MNDREELIKQLIKEKGGTREQYLSLLNKIAYHESAGTMDPSLKQYGGGPGRGVYQFEEGENEGAITAAKRTKQYLQSRGNKIPKWLENASAKDSLDASKLSKEQQDVLFLGNMRQHPKADFAKVWKGEESEEEFWANYHWAGAKEDRRERIKSFKDSTNRYLQSKETGTTNVADTNPSQHQAQPQQPHSALIQGDVAQEELMASPMQDNIQPIQQHQVAPQLMQPQASQPMTNLYDFMKKSGQKNEGELNSFEGGGTHQENPLGGIPQGVGANGKMNTVEEGETSFDLDGDKFIFSDRISLTDYIKKGKNTNPNQFEAGGKLNGGCGGPNQPPCADIKAYEPQSFGGKAWDAITNPMTAIESLVKTGSIPDNLDAAVRSGTAERNNLDMAVDVVNPLATARNIYNIPSDLRKGNYLNAAGSSLDVLPMGAVAKKLLNKKTLNGITDISGEAVSNTSRLQKIKEFAEPAKMRNRLETATNAIGSGKIIKALNPIHNNKANKALNEANEWMDNWYTHPETSKRINNLKDGPADLKSYMLQNDITDGLKTYKASFETMDNKVDNFLEGNSRVHKGNYGVSGWQLDKYTNMSKRQNLVDKYIDPNKIKTTAVHEGNHGFSDGNSLLNNKYTEELQKPFNMEGYTPRSKSGDYNRYEDYLLDPTEINARVSEIRLEHGIKPGQKVDEDLVNEIVEKGWYGNSIVDKEFYHLIKDRRSFLNMLNKVPAVVGGALTVAGATKSKK